MDVHPGWLTRSVNLFPAGRQFPCACEGVAERSGLGDVLHPDIARLEGPAGPRDELLDA